MVNRLSETISEIQTKLYINIARLTVENPLLKLYFTTSSRQLVKNSFFSLKESRKSCNLNVMTCVCIQMFLSVRVNRCD